MRLRSIFVALTNESPGAIKHEIFHQITILRVSYLSLAQINGHMSASKKRAQGID